jgi:hypothetical protein
MLGARRTRRELKLAVMVVELYEALKEAGASEQKA